MGRTARHERLDTRTDHQYDELRAALLDATAAVNTHRWWGKCKDAGADLVATRQALTHAPFAESADC
ncbi:hypothetical protein [Streptomyces griseoluteus]|uniref:hypothetical protein n=1 Tax=Streptomyces griseoluteus TaxID=29306 RepID=UPI00142EC231|nr:hypothetical protein [Streptomyces griseoluteus]